MRVAGGLGRDWTALLSRRRDHLDQLRRFTRTAEACSLVADGPCRGRVRADRRGRRDPVGRATRGSWSPLLRSRPRSAGSPMTVVLLRHGSAGDRDRWDGDDRLRPLDKKGRRQAEALRDALLARGVPRALSSPYVRCTETLAPLGLDVEPDERLAEGRESHAPHAPLLASRGPERSPARGGV